MRKKTVIGKNDFEYYMWRQKVAKQNGLHGPDIDREMHKLGKRLFGKKKKRTEEFEIKF